jgi:hypothetical protein
MIVVQLMGGLGNQMFQYAFGKQLAIQNKTTLKVDLTFLKDRTPRPNFVFRDFDLDIFSLSVDSAKKDDLKLFSSRPNKFRRIIAKLLKTNYVQLNENSFSFNKANFIREKNIHLTGYWQSPKYFKEIEQELRSSFQFKQQLKGLELDLFYEIKNEEAICINFRRGDFVNLKTGAETHGTPNENYYKNAIDFIASKTINPKFYIFSDDIEWCRENVTLEHPFKIIGHEYKGTKFAAYLQLMSACKHFIIPNSTFAWWGAWLNNDPDKIVISPKKWFENDELQNQTQDLIPEEWLKF